LFDDGIVEGVFWASCSGTGGSQYIFIVGTTEDFQMASRGEVDYLPAIQFKSTFGLDITQFHAVNQRDVPIVAPTKIVRVKVIRIILGRSYIGPGNDG